MNSDQRNHAEAFPVAYGLLPNISKLKYFDFFTEIKKLGYPKTIIVDFEAGAIEALTKTIPKAKGQGLLVPLEPEYPAQGSSIIRAIRFSLP